MIRPATHPSSTAGTAGPSLAPTMHRRAMTALVAPLAAAFVAACGGGGDTDPAPAGEAAGTSMESAQSISSDATTVGADGNAATAEAVSAASVVVGTGEAGQTIDCPGGGTARFTVSGASLATMANGRFDAGERYALSFQACRGVAGNAALDGGSTLVVVEASGDRLVVDTATTNLAVTLPQATIAFDGSARWEQQTTVAGSRTTRIGTWSSPSMRLVRTRNGQARSHTLTDVALTGTVVTADGAASSSALSGSATFGRTWPNGSYSVAMSIDGSAQYGPDGLPTAGEWTLTLPDDELALQLSGGVATATLDLGRDGSIDRSWSWDTATLVDGAE